jgi:hypothetical protein
MEKDKDDKRHEQLIEVLHKIAQAINGLKNEVDLIRHTLQSQKKG